MITGSSLFFLNSYQICCVYVTMADPALLRFDFKLTSDEKMQPVIQKYRRGRPFLNVVTRWSRSTSNLYALIGTNLTGELMKKMCAASWNLLTLTAEADRLLCQLVMFLTVFFHWMYKIKCSCYQESSVFHSYSLFVGVLVEKCVACHNGNPISDGNVFVFTLLDPMRKRV